jgi:isoleucyl-tRNA synthetase
MDTDHKPPTAGVELSSSPKTPLTHRAVATTRQALNTFNNTYLSTVYLDTAKDRLYIRASDDFARRSCQTVLHHTLRCLLAVVAPILPVSLPSHYTA